MKESPSWKSLLLQNPVRFLFLLNFHVLGACLKIKRTALTARHEHGIPSLPPSLLTSPSEHYILNSFYLSFSSLDTSKFICQEPSYFFKMELCMARFYIFLCGASHSGNKLNRKYGPRFFCLIFAVSSVAREACL